MCQIKTCMCFLFTQPIIRFPLLRGKFCPKYLTWCSKKEFDCDLAGSLKKCLLLSVVCYIACPKFMKGPSTIKCITILIEFSLDNNVDLRKSTVLSTVSFKLLKNQLIIITFLLQFLQTCLKHLTLSATNFSLLT